MLRQDVIQPAWPRQAVTNRSMDIERAQQATKTAVATAVALTLGGGAAAALASGLQLQEQAASGLGVAYSGMAAAVQDASTAFWNPAGMSLLTGMQFTGALHYIAPERRFRSSGSTYDALGNDGDGGPSALVPALFGTWALNPQWSVGLTINGPFGLATEWDAPWVGQFHAIRSEIETLNINPSVSFKVNNTIALGAGLSYQQLKAELTNAVPGTPSGPLPGGIVGAIQNQPGRRQGQGRRLGLGLKRRRAVRLRAGHAAGPDVPLDGQLHARR